MANRIRIAAIMIITAGMLTQFTNCAESLPDNLNQTSAESAAAAAAAAAADPNKITLSTSQPTILVNQTSQISAVGGVGPYIYTATAGSVSVSASGLVTGLAVGAATIEVNDQNGNHSNVSISVVASVSGTGASCMTAFGQTVPHAGTVNVYTAATVKCPATCTAQMLTCNNGALVGAIAASAGVAGSCSVSACVNKVISTGSCPNTPGGIRGSLGMAAPAATCSAAEIGKITCAMSGANYYEWQCSSP